MTQFGKNQEGVHASVMESSTLYFDWTTKVMESHIQKNVLEIGCGIGNASSHIRKSKYTNSLTSIDISDEIIEIAKKRHHQSDIAFKTQDLFDVSPNTYDSIVCSNTLEHIKNDIDAFSHIVNATKPNGKIALLMPAHNFLYSKYDFEVGHYKRYNKNTMKKLVTHPNVNIDSIFYFNFIGAIGWFVVNKVWLRKKVNNSSFSKAASIFEKYILPTGKKIETIKTPPFGLSVIALCTKTKNVN